jgi:predicted TIM-barrel fold metal-dependent hydrolase
MHVDLSSAEVVDDHCHGFTAEGLLAHAPEDFETRLTLMGMGFGSSAQVDSELWQRTRELTAGTAYSLLARRWLAERLGCDATAEGVAAARRRAIEPDPPTYIRALLDDEHIVGLVTDEGYPRPQIPSVEFERAVGGVRVHRVVRLESIVADAREGASTYEELEAAMVAALEGAAGDPRTVAFKSIIAYRTGLDVQHATHEEAVRGFERWRDAGWPENRTDAKPVRDRLLHVAAELAQARGLTLHIHTGDGDPEVDFARARPAELFAFLRDHPSQLIVLIHGGYPWSHEAGYIAALLPNVFVDLSVLIPWSGWGAERHLSDLIASVPASKLLYGSDQATEPEVLWIAARLARRALTKVLGDAVDSDYLSVEEAERMGRGILAGNTRDLHGI